jgi:tRNA1(Val) A37 N6-methylase TrmN6
MDIKLNENEHVEYLSREVGVIVSPEHTFGTDALLLASFAEPKKSDDVCDLGTGCGIIPFLFFRDGIKNITGVEIQENACDQAQRSIEMNGAADSVKILNCDLKELPAKRYNGEFSLVTMNPPYKKANAGIKSRSKSEQIARHETMCTLDDITECCSKILKYGGRLCMCGRPERLFETMRAMSNHNIEPKKLRMVQKRVHTPPWLFLLEGRLGGNSGLTVLPPLFIEKETGGDSDELLAILGKYREETV